MLAFTPGPDILFVVVTSLSQGFKTAVKFVLGLASGIILHTLFIVIGVSALITQSAYGLQILQVFAVFYLLWLAYKTFRHRKDSIHLKNVKRVDNYYLRGFIMNISNPKVMLFFLAFFPRFANLENEGYQLRLIILGLIFIVVTIISFSFVAWISSRVRDKVIENAKAILIINWFAIFVFISISALLVFDNFPSK